MAKISCGNLALIAKTGCWFEEQVNMGIFLAAAVFLNVGTRNRFRDLGTSRDCSVNKQNYFWLWQSHDYGRRLWWCFECLAVAASENIAGVVWSFISDYGNYQKYCPWQKSVSISVRLTKTVPAFWLIMFFVAFAQHSEWSACMTVSGRLISAIKIIGPVRCGSRFVDGLPANGNNWGANCLIVPRHCIWLIRHPIFSPGLARIDGWIVRLLKTI